VQLLDDLRSNDAWKEQGLTIGQPVTRIPLKGPEPKPELVLHNPIQLSPRQTKSLLRLLERNEKRLEKISEEEVKKGSRALGRAYRLILEYVPPSKAESDTPED
jgi:hypothetical protein